MPKSITALLIFMLSVVSVAASAQAPSAAAKVREVLNRPDAQFDYLDAALTLDRLIDKDSDLAATRPMVARLVDAARQMAGPHPNDTYKLAAVRQAIYVAGAWNYNRAFAYDLEDPLGTHVRNKMLSTYVRMRKGNCLSMPVLFLIVADGRRNGNGRPGFPAE